MSQLQTHVFRFPATLINMLIATGGLMAIVLPQFAGISHEMKPSPGHSHGTTHHSHPKVEVPPGQPVPTVNLVVRPDAMNGWNLEVKVTNFTFAPERINTKSTSVNEGHAHLYVNGQKVSRLYGAWYHLPSLPPGTHNITVTLNTNDHGDLMYQGQPIQATETIQVSVPKK
ncbi:MAG: hypothetical protein NW220_04670 [Leptolyngbyaceae cyanobacterium bins.349]|nr:hypothetical protein [Leptolyngbyaceae cyanobacterium bins.349]